MQRHDSRVASPGFVSNASDGKGGRKPRRTHAERRAEAEQRMLEAAVRVVAEHGLDYLTLAECGEAAGYSRGLAAHYFGSKEALIAAIATHIVADYSKRLRGGSRGHRGIEGFLESVAFYIDAGRGRLMPLRAFNAVLGSGLTQPTITASIAELNRVSIAAFAAGMRKCVAQGEMRSDIDPTAQATLLISQLRGVMTQWLIDPQHVDLDAIKAALLENLRRSLSA